MRQLTDIELNRIKLLTENSIELTLIEPTETGLIKSIMDATGSVRSYLKSKNIHDFELQKQGQESKIQVKRYFDGRERRSNHTERYFDGRERRFKHNYAPLSIKHQKSRLKLGLGRLF